MREWVAHVQSAESGAPQRQRWMWAPPIYFWKFVKNQRGTQKHQLLLFFSAADSQAKLTASAYLFSHIQMSIMQLKNVYLKSVGGRLLLRRLTIALKLCFLLRLSSPRFLNIIVSIVQSDKRAFLLEKLSFSNTLVLLWLRLLDSDGGGGVLCDVLSPLLWK